MTAESAQGGSAGGASSALWEREAERASLRGALVAASQGRGSLVLIEGPGGIGKSRLLEEARVGATAEGFASYSAIASELEADIPFGIVRQLFEHELATMPEADQAQALSGAAALALPVFPALGSLEAPAAAETQWAVLHGLYWLVAHLSARGPVLLTIDDLHWADAPSLRFLRYLAARVEGMRALVIGTARAGEPGSDDEVLAEVALASVAVTLQPEPLSGAGVREIIAAALGEEPEEPFTAACLEATGGNPFYLHELLRELARAGARPSASEAPTIAETAPAGLRRAVMRRLKQLPPSCEAYAAAVAVLGDEPRADLAAELAELSAEDARAASGALVRAGLITRAGGFTHPVVRSAVYSALDAETRASRHSRAARLLRGGGATDAVVALHLLRAQATEEWALAVLRSAAAESLARGAPELAARYLQRALTAAVDGPTRADLLEELGAVESVAPGPGSFVHLRQALDEAEDPARRVTLAIRLASALLLQGFMADAARVLETARADLESQPALVAPITRRLANAALAEFAVVRRLGGYDTIAAELAQHGAEDDAVAMAALAWIRTATTPPAADGAALARQALQEQPRSLEEYALLLAAATPALMAAGELEEVDRIWSDLADHARRRGLLSSLAISALLNAPVLVRLGRLEEARAGLDEVVAYTRELELSGYEMPLAGPWILAPLIDVLIEQGELEDAQAALRGTRLETPLPDDLGSAYLLDTLGRFELAANRPEQAARHLLECGARLEAVGLCDPGFIPWRSHLAEAWLASGDHAGAQELVAREVDLARSFGVRRELGIALRVAGLAAGGDEGIAILREAVETLAGSSARLEHARALVDLGAAIRRAGRRAEAREPLRAALALAERCRAHALSERAHAELLAAGARPRRRALSGFESLTPSEQRVARLAARGLTNRRIGEELFVTEKTVEGHMAEIFRKLELRSRTQLSAALPSAEP